MTPTKADKIEEPESPPEPYVEHKDILEDELKSEFFDHNKWKRFVVWKMEQRGWEQSWSRNNLYQAIQEFKECFKYGRDFSKLSAKNKELYQFKMGMWGSFPDRTCDTKLHHII